MYIESNEYMVDKHTVRLEEDSYISNKCHNDLGFDIIGRKF